MSWRLGNSIRIRPQNSFAAWENLNDSKDINGDWENITENIKTSAKESLGLQKLKQLNHGLIKKV